MKKGLIIAGCGLLVAALAATAVALLQGSNTPRSEAFLQVQTPENESIVTSPELSVTGTADAAAVVSVNGTLVDLDAEGHFSALLTLEEGPNCIEVVASDYEGNEASEILTVIYVA